MCRCMPDIRTGRVCGADYAKTLQIGNDKGLLMSVPTQCVIQGSPYSCHVHRRASRVP